MIRTIAVDGPAASGKGTLSRRLADHYRFHHLDTGLSYRAVARAMLDRNISLDDEPAAARVAETIDLGRLDRALLATHEVGEAASRIAVMPQVRRCLVDLQRQFSMHPPGAVLDGRDIGTVVCPDAMVKLFVTASPETRAQRRHDEIVARGGTADYAAILDDLARRDARDMGRSDSPLRPADDAHLLDTTEMGIESAFRAAKDLIDRATASRNAD